jgi:2,3-bisphosphoglycerate-dependent phosphoglycerate mutase
VTTIHLVRHGETDWNRELRWQGHSDVPLNERGREQARKLADELSGAPLAAVYSSDLRRASETAQIVADRLSLPVQTDAALREIDVGSWEGFTLANLEARSPEAVTRWDEQGEHGWEDGESHTAMVARVREAIQSIAARHEGEEVLVVSHGGPIRALKALAAGLDYPRDRRSVPRTDNCEVCVIAIEDGAVRGID